MNGMTISEIRAYSGADIDLFYLKDFPKQGFFRWDPSDATSIDDGCMILKDASTTPRRYKRIIESYVTPEMFGAIGDGYVDDTAALTAAVDYCLSIIKGIPDVVLSPEYVLGGPELRLLPTKVYKYDGPGIVPQGARNKAIRIVGSGVDRSCIRIVSSAYFLSLTDVNHLTFKDFTVVGGKGFFVQTYPGINVRRHLIIDNCEFINYTVCAIGGNATDMPNWNIKKCRFMSDKNAKNSIAIALSGLTDSCIIEDCEFWYNRYAVKLGIGGNNAKISKNFFAMPRVPTVENASDMSAGIWIVPATSSGIGGTGLAIQNNKFGNEGLTANSTKILIAAESTGSDFFYERTHSTSTNSQFFTGANILDNSMYGNQVMDKGYIYSYTSNIGALLFRGNKLAGSGPNYLFEFDAAITQLRGSTESKTNVVEIPTHYFQDTNGFILKPCNLRGFAKYIDFNGVALRSDTFDIYTSPTDKYVQLAKSNGRITTMWSATRTTETGFYGSCAKTVFSHVDAYSFATLNLDNYKKGDNVFVEVDLKKSDTQPLSHAIVFLKRNDASFQRELSRVVELNDNWTTFRLTCNIQQVNAGEPIRLMVQPHGLSIGVNDTLLIGDIRAYSSASPVNYQHLSTAGEGTFDQPHLILGSNHLWIDSSNRLRIKSSKPTSDTDGTVVGSQS